MYNTIIWENRKLESNYVVNSKAIYFVKFLPSICDLDLVGKIVI